MRGNYKRTVIHGNNSKACCAKVMAAIIKYDCKLHDTCCLYKDERSACDFLLDIPENNFESFLVDTKLLYSPLPDLQVGMETFKSAKVVSYD